MPKYTRVLREIKYYFASQQNNPDTGFLVAICIRKMTFGGSQHCNRYILCILFDGFLPIVSALCYYFFLFDVKIPFLLTYLQKKYI